MHVMLKNTLHRVMRWISVFSYKKYTKVIEMHSAQVKKLETSSLFSKTLLLVKSPVSRVELLSAYITRAGNSRTKLRSHLAIYSTESN